MNPNRSYVISVSAGTGCYRHIRISEDATLFDLHGAILEAFGFADDHAHAFFMNNQTWSDTDSYYSERTEEESRRTCDYKLSEMALYAGKRFKYVFDFGDEWVFSCKVLRVSDEPCGLPAVVRSKGEAPKQYPREDESGDGQDADDADFPEIYAPAKLKKMYAGLALPEETTSLLHTYFDAMARLYGVIPLRKALEIINSQNDGSVSEKDFTAFAEIVRHEEHFYCILGADERHAGGAPTAPLDRELVADSLYAVDLDDYDRLVESQMGKPYYIPPKEEFLKYADDGYYESTRQSRVLRDYLRRQKGLTKARAEEFVQELQLFASEGDDDLQDVLDDMVRMGLEFKTGKEIGDFIRLYIDMSNHTRMPRNRGYTPDELSANTPPDRRIPKAVSFGPHLTAALQNGVMDGEELRRGILQMDLPSEGLRKSMLDNLDRIRNSSSPAPATGKKKIGRNDPCPCGSGKKYKHCCGRNQ